MTIQTEIQSLSPSAILEFFVLDMTQVGNGTSYFHAGTNQLQQPIVWQGTEYSALPIECQGFDITAKGTLPRPILRVANINGVFSAAVHQYDDLVGCKLTRKRTYARFIDAVNFPNGVNPEADPNQSFQDDLWFVDRKTTENKYMIEWELASAFDLQGVMLPNRQVIQNSCPWKYRGPECGYTGPYMDVNDAPCTVDQDFCSKRLASCSARFGASSLPFGGFPGAVRRG